MEAEGGIWRDDGCAVPHNSIKSLPSICDWLLSGIFTANHDAVSGFLLGQASEQVRAHLTATTCHKTC